MASRPNGFTLLELLVVVVVFGLLLVTLTQGFHFGLLAWRTEARAANTDADLSEVDLTLRHLVEAMDPGRQEAAQPTMLGGHNEMTFVTELPAAGGTLPPRPAEVTLLVDAQHRLILRWRPYLHADYLRPPPPPVDTELLRGVSRMELAFWQRSGGWTATWQTPELPTMIRIHLQFVDGDPRHWPDLVMAPRLDRP
jgi:general secretion pathway protein J